MEQDTCKLVVHFSEKGAILSGTLSECQTFWIQIRLDVLRVLIWIHTVFKRYPPKKKDATGKGSIHIGSDLYPNNGRQPKVLEPRELKYFDMKTKQAYLFYVFQAGKSEQYDSF